MEGDALRWYTGLDDEVKESLDQTFEALFEEFVPRAAFQAELEKEYLKLRHNRGQSVNEFGRDLMLVVGEMDDPPSMAKQIIHFKKGLLPSIKRKMEIREYLDLADIITQAKLVEADCINELSEEFDSGLTKGMFKRGGDNTLFLGIQEVEGSLETKREGTEILFTSISNSTSSNSNANAAGCNRWYAKIN